MKKGIAAIFVLLGMTSIAQQDQFDALKEVGNESIFKGYRQVSKNGDKYTAVAMDGKYILSYINNVHGKLSTFELADQERGKVKINSGFGFIDPNHYTAPSLFCSESGRGYVYLNGLLYGLDDLDTPQDTENFTIECIYIPVAKKEPGKKLTVKERLAKAKAAMLPPKELTERDHKVLLKEYLEVNGCCSSNSNF